MPREEAPLLRRLIAARGLTAAALRPPRRTAAGYGARPRAGYRPSAVRLAQPGVRSALRAARAEQVRTALAGWRVQLELLQGTIDAWEGHLEGAAGPAPALQIYDGRGAVPAAPLRTESGSASTLPAAALLYAIFDRLDPARDFDESGFPRAEVVDAELGARSFAPADPAYLRRVFEGWLHARGAPSSGPPAEDPPANRVFLYAAFQSLDLDDPADMNRLGIPRMAAVNRLLPAGYAVTDPDELADAFAEWCELDEEEDPEASPAEPLDAEPLDAEPLDAEPPPASFAEGYQNVYPVFPLSQRASR